MRLRHPHLLRPVTLGFWAASFTQWKEGEG
jgi:hypothetical protein